MSKSVVRGDSLILNAQSLPATADIGEVVHFSSDNRLYLRNGTSSFRVVGEGSEITPNRRLGSITNGGTNITVTGMLLDSGLHRYVIMQYRIRRKDNVRQEIRAGSLHIYFDEDSGNWIIDDVFVGDDDPEITWNFNSNQLRYSASTFGGGGYTSDFRYKVIQEI